MNPWERDFFEGMCPYTNKFCTTDIACSDCEVNEQEREDMKAFDEKESEDI